MRREKEEWEEAGRQIALGEHHKLRQRHKRLLMCVRLKTRGMGQTPKPQSVKNMQEKVQSNPNEMAKVYFYNGKGRELGRKAREAGGAHKFPANLRWRRVSSIKQRAPDFRLHGNAPKGGKSRLQKTSKKWCAKYLYSFLLKKKKNLETYKTYIKRKTILFVQYVSSQ